MISCVLVGICEAVPTPQTSHGQNRHRFVGPFDQGRGALLPRKMQPLDVARRGRRMPVHQIMCTVWLLLPGLSFPLCTERSGD